MAGQLVVPCRLRSCIIRAGGKSAIVAFVTGLSAVLLSRASVGTGEALLAAAAAGVGTAAGAFFALALSRPVEWLFGYSSKLVLMELLSYDHPLLRQFMVRAPGTFQHSVAVALLAQAAAEAIGADSLLVRVGALYHDVGKMDAPQFFTENQQKPSAHEAIEPLENARVILTHPERGVELLTQYRVGGRIADFVREHHGTGALVSFLQRAEAAGLRPDQATYRYAGPRPRSRETAVLMMADKIEAMARSRGAASESEFRAIVDGTLDGLLDDGQLDDSPMTLRDLARLGEAFVTALMSLHHTRVAYPALARRALTPAGRSVRRGVLPSSDGLRGRCDTGSRAGVAERLPVNRHEFPVVAPALQRQLQDSVRLVLEHLAVGLRPGAVVEGVTAGSGDELADPAGIGPAVRILGGESFVDVLVAVDDDVDPVLEHEVEHVAHEDVVAVLARTE